MNENGTIIRNKGRLVAQKYSPEKGIDFKETYAPMARLEVIRILITFAVSQSVKLFQIEVKSAFFNGYIKEEVYVKQPPCFEDQKYPNHVFKLTKTLYGLKQAPRVWYECLSSFLLEFQRGKVDITLFIKHTDSDMIIVRYT